MQAGNKITNGDAGYLVISYLSLRKFVGVLGVALPFVSVAGTFLLSDCRQILPSISQYYYSVMGDFLVGTLCGVAIFLFSYRGYETIDRVVCWTAGVSAVGAAFFPTHIDTDYIACYRTDQDATDFSDVAHTVTAGLFFISLALMSIFLFTKSKGYMTPQKVKRNMLYRISGYTILVSISCIALYEIPAVHAYFEKYKPIVLLETLALAAFGLSWLTKGEFLLKDEQTG